MKLPLRKQLSYSNFLTRKTQVGCNSGFKFTFIPDKLFNFQKFIVEWIIAKGRGAVFADCGLGKTSMQLTWAQNVVEKTNKPVLVLTPLAVGPQTIKEAHKFGIEAEISREGKFNGKIVVTNYERLHYFNREDFAGVVCDESSILKSFDGITKAAVTEFMRKVPYRSLWTATAAPNDYIELGTSSEALGYLGYMDMLALFFKNAQNSLHPSVYGHGGMDFNKLNESAKWRFRGHAEKDFWRWVCSWARAIRQPSDFGFENNGFKLPQLKIVEHIVKATTPRDDMLFDLPAIGLAEQRHERRRTLNERCEMAAQLAYGSKQVICWCYLNDEGHLLEKIINGAVEVDGNDPDEKKEEVIEAFVAGQIRVVISKPVIFGFGLNLQNCHHQTFFPSHSFEQWYQAVRRSWRFGQKYPVRVDMISSEGEAGVMTNLNRKMAAAEIMFKSLVELMGNELKLENKNLHLTKTKKPSWL